MLPGLELPSHRLLMVSRAGGRPQDVSAAVQSTRWSCVVPEPQSRTRKDLTTSRTGKWCEWTRYLGRAALAPPTAQWRHTLTHHSRPCYDIHGHTHTAPQRHPRSSTPPEHEEPWVVDHNPHLIDKSLHCQCQLCQISPSS